MEGRDGAPDAYALMGVDSSAAAGEIKRRYWRLSLTIHPDKCDHPRAAEAFDAIARAAKDLQVWVSAGLMQ